LKLALGAPMRRIGHAPPSAMNLREGDMELLRQYETSLHVLTAGLSLTLVAAIVMGLLY
jgi:hypothetical protein